MITVRPALSTRTLVDDAVERAIQRIERRGDNTVSGSTQLTSSIARVSRGGKRVRPALVIDCFVAFGGEPDDAPALLQVAAAYELLHTAFVVHDDVIDHDEERRGTPNVSGEFRQRGRHGGADSTGSALLGTAAAILAGDILLFEATRLIAVTDLPHPVRQRLLDLLDEAVHVSAAGELADVENSVLPHTPHTDALLRVAHDKTAVYSFVAPLCSGAVLAGADDASVSLLALIGGHLGLAFQLVDDLIGAFGSADQAGRETGADLREAKRTPLVGLARESTTWRDVADALTLAPTGPIAVRDAQRALDESGARARMHAVIDENLTAARSAASALPERAQDLVRNLAHEVERRIP